MRRIDYIATALMIGWILSLAGTIYAGFNPCPMGYDLVTLDSEGIINNQIVKIRTSSCLSN
jgi:hypothetical protein